MGTREEAIDDLILALIYLTRFNDREGIPFNEMAWKNYDFDAIARLDMEDLIIDPKNRRGGSYKYAYLTEKGRAKAREILGTLGVADFGLYRACQNLWPRRLWRLLPRRYYVGRQLPHRSFSQRSPFRRSVQNPLHHCFQNLAWRQFWLVRPSSRNGRSCARLQSLEMVLLWS